ncbi:MAG: hypothetical protein V2J51_04340 [Erythrobacter sp.]|jgi:Ca2+-binding EF-hand superfamily protein|nr:hypothetical protein [Erythrobacter sp.]
MTIVPRLFSCLAGAALFAAAPLAAQPGDMDPEKMQAALEQLTKMLKEADANEDGSTTREEFARYRADRFSKLDRNGDGVVNGKDAPRGPVPKKKFGEAIDKASAQFDTDLDGTVTRAEWNAMKRDPFEMLDANGNGAIEASEIPSLPAG